MQGIRRKMKASAFSPPLRSEGLEEECKREIWNMTKYQSPRSMLTNATITDNDVARMRNIQVRCTWALTQSIDLQCHPFQFTMISIWLVVSSPVEQGERREWINPWYLRWKPYTDICRSLIKIPVNRNCEPHCKLGGSITSSPEASLPTGGKWPKKITANYWVELLTVPKLLNDTLVYWVVPWRKILLSGTTEFSGWYP